MPTGADPHEFSPSARRAEAIVDADLLVVNGAGLEQSMQGIVEEAASVFTVADHVELRTVDGAIDPHVWTDPHEMASAMRAFGERAEKLPGRGYLMRPDGVTRMQVALPPAVSPAAR